MRTSARNGETKSWRRSALKPYLRTHPQCRLRFKWQSPPKGVIVFSDSDWAGDKPTTKSTSGAMVMHGIHMVCFASRLQKVVALSSGKAKLNAHAFGLCERTWSSHSARRVEDFKRRRELVG